MTIQTLDALIDKQDNFEIVRDQIAGILATETLNQQSLATTAGKDPEQWAFDVYTERTNPWAKWLNDPGKPTDTTPIVNVAVDTSQFPENRGTAGGQVQGHDVTYNIDCYAFGHARGDGTGHIPGDEDAGLELGRIVRLVRNILVAAENTYLQYRAPGGVVSMRWIQSLTFFQAAQDNQAVQNIRAARIALFVKMTESAPQLSGDVLESIFTEIKRDGDGKVIVEFDADVT